MLAIRMQRTGRKGHAQFRVIVQESWRTPASGKVVARLGSYDPHAKTIILDKEKAEFYLKNGAQPSDRAARLMKSEGVKLPSWVKVESNKERTVRNPEKRRSTAPAEPEAPAEEAPAEEPATPAEEVPAEEAPATEEAPAETAEAPAEEPAPEEAPAAEAPAAEPEAAPTEEEAPAEEKSADESAE